MRSRDRDQDWIEELGRRRLEALIAELTPSTPRAASPSDREAEDPADPAGGHDLGEHQDLGADAALPDLSGLPVLPDEPSGRHARRALSARGRLTGWVGDRLPEGLRERHALQQGHVGVLALVLAVAVLLGGWAWLRSTGGGPSATAAPVVTTPSVTMAGAPGGPSGALSPLTSPSAAASSTTEVVVHVAGRVRRPGIVVLPTGSRVIDAVRRAGGFAPGVGPRSAALNLARLLVDGEQIVVGQAQAAAPVGAAPSDGASGATGPLVSLNTADQTALESLPGVGPVTAAAILQWRSEHGPFTAVEQLLDVSGIGEATLAEIEPHVTL